MTTPRVRLSTTQQNLLDAMRSGVRVHFMSGLNAHCFRTDTHASCTATVAALRRKGLIEAYNIDWRGCMYRLRPEGKEPRCH
jgi:hypothetical protein